jgi:cytochrome P450
MLATRLATRRLMRQLPSGPKLPVAVQTLATWSRPAAGLLRARQIYGKRFTVRVLGQPPFVILSDPNEIKQVFQSPPDVLHPGEGARVLEPILGPNSVILLDEDPHLAQRKLMLPAFHGEAMQRLQGLMEELTERELASWPVGEPVALHPRLQRLTLEIVLRAVFGLEQGARLDRLRGLLTEVLEFAESPLSILPFAQRALAGRGAMGRLEKTGEEADRLIYALIEGRRGERELSEREPEGEPTGEREGNGARDRERSERDSASGPGERQPEGEAADVLALLLAARHEDGSPMSDQELRDELMTALVAGHETTASQLAWGFEQLARAPRVLDRLVDELECDRGGDGGGGRRRRDDNGGGDSSSGGGGGGGGEAYLTATIQELMRRRPVLMNAEPRLVKKPVRIGGVEYPPGVVLIANALLVHHDPDVYERPGELRPERFLESEGGRAPGTYTWLPFGGGRRRCLGASFAMLEMKVVLRAVVERFRIEPVGERAETARRRSITISPSRGCEVLLRERARAHEPAPNASGREREASEEGKREASEEGKREASEEGKREQCEGERGQAPSTSAEWVAVTAD